VEVTRSNPPSPYPWLVIFKKNKEEEEEEEEKLKFNGNVFT
jgi:hypothetical protein